MIPESHRRDGQVMLEEQKGLPSLWEIEEDEQDPQKQTKATKEYALERGLEDRSKMLQDRATDDAAQGTASPHPAQRRTHGSNLLEGHLSAPKIRGYDLSVLSSRSHLSGRALRGPMIISRCVLIQRPGADLLRHLSEARRFLIPAAKTVGASGRHTADRVPGIAGIPRWRRPERSVGRPAIWRRRCGLRQGRHGWSVRGAVT